MTSACPEKDRIQIGSELTKCLGAGANPDIGRQAAEADLDEIVKQVGETNMCFIAAGMGGGTGTGAAPVIAKALKDKGILTIGMVCMPFRFEGKRKMALALEGIKAMQGAVDTLIIVQNERLLLTINESMKGNAKRVSLKDSFKMVDDIFYEGIKAVTDVIIKPGLINLDFADVRTITEGPGWGIMGTGFAEGHGKAEVATIAALNNPLLSDTSKKNATGVLVSITGGPDMAILEVDEILRLIRQEVSEDANVIFGATCDTELKGAIRVSLILTGPYESETPVYRPMEEVTEQVKVTETPSERVNPAPVISQAPPSQSPKRESPPLRNAQVFHVNSEGMEPLNSLNSAPTSTPQLKEHVASGLESEDKQVSQPIQIQREDNTQAAENASVQPLSIPKSEAPSASQPKENVVPIASAGTPDSQKAPPKVETTSWWSNKWY
jgi:cell division protein FtsZ